MIVLETFDYQETCQRIQSSNKSQQVFKYIILTIHIVLLWGLQQK